MYASTHRQRCSTSSLLFDRVLSEWPWRSLVTREEKTKGRRGEERREKEMGEREVAGDNKTRQSVGDITGIGR
jgi:hypothetical protein